MNTKYVGQVRGYARDGDCGADLACAETVTVMARRHASIALGCRLQAPPDIWIWLTARSSTWSRLGLMVIDGVIDSGFRGDLFARVYNPGLVSVTVQEGDRIVQAIAMPLVRMNFVQVAALDPSERGENGFGSTGV